MDWGSNDMTKLYRKKEIEQIYNEGYKAAKVGKHIQSCPQRYLYSMDRYHWETGHKSFENESVKEAGDEEGRERALADDQG